MKNTEKRLFGMMILLVGIMLVFGFTACDDGNGNDNGGNGGNGGNNYTAGWPSSSVMTEFGLSGLTAPTGATSTEYNVVTTSAYKYLSINFIGSLANDTVVNNAFTSNGWTLDEGSSWIDDEDDEDFYFVYEKAGFGYDDNDSFYSGNGNYTHSRAIFVVKAN